MKKRGFTLIELLAVIVILAIIALIATPILMNVIENVRKGAAERGAEGYIDAVETAIMEARIDGKVLEEKTYTLAQLEEITGSIKTNGNKPIVGTVTIKNGMVETNPKTKIIIGDYQVSYDDNENIISSKEKTIYRYEINKDISIGGKIELANYTTDPVTLDHNNYYLKYIVESDVVTKSYVCAKFGGEETCLRGGVDDNGDSYYDENVLTLQSLKSEGFDCSIDDYEASCNKDSIYLYTAWTGAAQVHNMDLLCKIEGVNNKGEFINNTNKSSCVQP